MVENSPDKNSFHKAAFARPAIRNIWFLLFIGGILAGCSSEKSDYPRYDFYLHCHEDGSCERVK